MNEPAEIEQEPAEIEKEPVEMSATEEQARKGGWKPETEWEEDDPKRPKEFNSAEVFNANGVWIERHKDQQKRMDDMESSFNTRLDGVNKIHQQQLDVQKSDLIRQRDEAIDGADRETANKIQDDIDNLATPAVEAVSSDQTTLDNWNRSNPWIFQSGPKSAYAHSQLAQYERQGMNVAQCLANMEADINREFPAINPNRETQPTPEGGSKPGKKRSAKVLTMSDCTEEERRIYKLMPGTWATEKDYLKAVQDARAAQ